MRQKNLLSVHLGDAEWQHTCATKLYAGGTLSTSDQERKR